MMESFFNRFSDEWSKAMPCAGTNSGQHNVVCHA